MTKQIAISLSPNAQKDDIYVAIKSLFTFWRNDRRSVQRLEIKLSEYFGKGYEVFSLNSGRSALYLLLKSLGITNGDEVIVQAFTCSAVANPIKWNDAKPVYVDIGTDYNISISDLNNKITKNTKVIVVQHTFGIPADMKGIREKIGKRNIVIVEDLAHGLGASYEGQKLGTFSDVAFLSFGRDKAISSVFGGAIITRNKEMAKLIKALYDNLKYPKSSWTLQQVLHPIAFSIILPLYSVGLGKLTLGKLILFVFQKLHILSKPLSDGEKKGIKPNNYPEKLPAALSYMAENQLIKLDRFVANRTYLSNIYYEKLNETNFELPIKKTGSSLLRFPLQVDDKVGLIRFAKSRNILLGDWYKKVIVPSEDLGVFDYKISSCPYAEKVAERIVNLPTNPNMDIGDAQRVSKVIREWLNT